MAYRPLLPLVQSSNIPTVCTEIPESCEDRRTNQRARKSLFSPDDASSVANEVEITIHYSSGDKTTQVTDIEHIKMCKVIHGRKNVVKGLLNIIKSSCPEEIINCAANIVQSECLSMCKRHSDFPLNDKSYAGIMEFSWDSLHQQILLKAPNTLRIISAMVSNELSMPVPSKEFLHVMFAMGITLHGRNRETTTFQYLNGMVLLHGGCTQHDIERLAQLGICVVPKTVRNKLQLWQDRIDSELLEVKEKWINGDNKTFQLVGDNWDKNISPSYRTSKNETQSLHLFNVVGVIDRITIEKNTSFIPKPVGSLTTVDFLPTDYDLCILKKEITFLIARSVIENNVQINDFLGHSYPDHLEHRYSEYAGRKTSQYSLGLFDCDEKKTQDVIQLLKQLSKYVPQENGQIIEEVFFGGDRLTDERIQVAQQAMSNADSSLERLEGFISKIEDFHRLMNFLEAIHKVAYNSNSSRDRGTLYYFRNLLNARNVKGEVKNSYRAYKHLFYTVFDGICCVLFLKHFNLNQIESEIPLPDESDKWSDELKIDWLNSVCGSIVDKYFLQDDNITGTLREVLLDPNHEDNYWISSMKDGKFKCHFCISEYSFLESLKAHEKVKHNFEQDPTNKTKRDTDIHADELNEYLLAIFKLIGLHKNLDSAVNMGDGHRVVRSAKYELPIYHRTNKVKYFIGSAHLTAMVAETLPPHQTERLIANRFINISGGKNNNIALDEFVEILNRDTKNTCSGFQTKESIIQHSKEFPHLINAVKHFDEICNCKGRKGFHKLPSYQADVKKVASDLVAIDAFTECKGRKLICRKLVQSRNPFDDCHKGLAEMILRHKPDLPFRRLSNKHM